MGRTSLRLAGVLVAGSVLALAGCGGPDTTSTTTSANGSAGVNLGTAATTINATDQLQFTPATATVHTGEIVQWQSTATVEHTVTFDTESALSDPSLPAGGKWQVKFTKPGTYTYHCSIHAGMTGTV